MLRLRQREQKGPFSGGQFFTRFYRFLHKVLRKFALHQDSRKRDSWSHWHIDQPNGLEA
jgi:hypothetical protein